MKSTSPAATVFRLSVVAFLLAGGSLLAGAHAGAATGRLIFSDEFNGTAVDRAVWVVIHRPGDDSNPERECYTPDNVTEGGGYLHLTTTADRHATPCPLGGYRSGMVQTRTFAYTYGTLDIRAKMPGGVGPWPALWLLGSNCQKTNVLTANNVGPCRWPQPGSDEIDMTEFLGSDWVADWQSLHSNGYNADCTPPLSDASANWHVYTLVWRKGSIVWKIDGKTTCTMTTHVPSTPMFLIMNTAVSDPVHPATLPQAMEVDYVRVYQ